MKHISKRDAERILNHIKKATAIFEAAELQSDTGMVGMDGKLIDRISYALSGLEYYINETYWE